MSIVIKKIAGPVLMKVTYPDLNYQLTFGLNNQGAATMTPDQVEACAKRAYEIFVANTNEAAPWDAVKRKHEWVDIVRSHEQNPDAIGRNQNANLQERCIAQAYSEIYQPAAEQPLVVPPVAAEPAAEAETAPAEAQDAASVQTPTPDENDKKGKGNKGR